MPIVEPPECCGQAMEWDSWTDVWVCLKCNDRKWDAQDIKEDP